MGEEFGGEFVRKKEGERGGERGKGGERGGGERERGRGEGVVIRKIVNTLFLL